MHLAIAGNIGSGKTTLTTLLAKHYRYTPHFEQVDDNPYLNDFYKDMTRWSFNLQVYFLKSRFSQLIEMKKKGKPIIQDRTIYEDAHIFAPNLQAMGLMTSRDFENYLSLFELMEEFVTPPDLMVYLRASVPTLVAQIQKRGREYEEAIRLDYLNRLNERYEAWISTYSKGELLIIDVDNNNFHEDKEDLGGIITAIDGKLNSLFSRSEWGSRLLQKTTKKPAHWRAFFMIRVSTHIVGTPMTENPTLTSSLMNQSSLSLNVWEWYVMLCLVRSKLNFP